MKIWLDTAVTDKLARSGWNDYSSDCSDCGSPGDDCSDCVDDCSDCSAYVSDQSPSILLSHLPEEDLQYIRRDYLQQAAPLYVHSCGDGRQIVCSPTETGRLAILDEIAFSLLEQFRTPSTLSRVKQAFSSYPPTSIESTVVLLYRLGFLKPSSYNITGQRKQTSQQNTLSVWLHVTNACNLNCHYCYIAKTPERMNDDVSRRAVDAIMRSATKQGFRQVQIKYAGGEASLNIGNVLNTHDYAAQQARQHNISLRAILMSNGVALSERTITQLRERRIGITISLDGIGAYHDSQRPFIKGQGSFKYVDRTIQRLLDLDYPPHISATVSHRNLAGLSTLFSYLLERNLTFSLNYYRENECSAHVTDLQTQEQEMIEGMRVAFAVLEEQLSKRCLLRSLLDKASISSPHQHVCSVGRQYLVIDQRGGVTKCQADMECVVTTVDVDDPLRVIQNDVTGLRALPVDEKEGCRTCEWRYWCAGGCPQLTYRMTGRNDVKSPYCNIYKALFPDVLRLEAMRLLRYSTPITLVPEYAVTKKDSRGETHYV